ADVEQPGNVGLRLALGDALQRLGALMRCELARAKSGLMVPGAGALAGGADYLEGARVTYQERLPPPAAVIATAAPTPQEELPPRGEFIAPAAPTPQEELPPRGAFVATAAPTPQEELSSEFNQKIEKLQADLAISSTKIAELERAKS